MTNHMHRCNSEEPSNLKMIEIKANPPSESPLVTFILTPSIVDSLLNETQAHLRITVYFTIEIFRSRTRCTFINTCV